MNKRQWRISTVFTIATGCASAWCGGVATTTGPSPNSGPFPAAETLQITPGDSSIAVGATIELSAIVVGPNGRRTAEPCSWSVEPAGRVSVNGGAVTGLAPGFGVITAVCTLLRAARQMTVVPAIGGTWAGNIRISSCQRVSGAGSDPCRFRVGSEHPIAVDVTQRGEILEGSFGLFRPAATGPLTGVLSSEGLLTGAATLSRQEDRRTVHVTVVDVRFEAERAVGVFHADNSFTNAFGVQQLRETYEIVTLTR